MNDSWREVYIVLYIPLICIHKFAMNEIGFNQNQIYDF